MAGYSKRPLYKKIGIKEGSRVVFANAPENIDEIFEEMPEVEFVGEEEETMVDVILLFAMCIPELLDGFPIYMKRMEQAGMLWVAWPKQASKVPTDLNGNIVRSIGLEQGLVDTKVCAIDETWSGLKFMVRREDRK